MKRCIVSGGGIMRIRLKRKTISILAYITSIVAYAMFLWIDWRLGVAMLIFELSNVFTEIMEARNEKGNRD